MKAQPAIMKVSAAVTAGAPPNCTAVLDGIACTVPPCGHISTLAVVSMPLMRSPPARRC